jgi:predicted negative regulator of RcsB-dependent stress response
MAAIKNILRLLLVMLIASCSSKPINQITNAQDYEQFLNLSDNKSVDLAHKGIIFWEDKLDRAPNQSTYLGMLASNYAVLFEYTGAIENLHKTESLLEEANQAGGYGRVGTLRSLARNYIAQHRFKEALVLANKAFAIGEEKKETQKLLFDVQMELGNYDEAVKNLNEIKDFNDYDYLIRIAKWNDHKGDLLTAIQFIEKARSIAENKNNMQLRIWVYSCLGDFYGHAGRIKDSYNSYLQTLELDPNYSYALKGIAWIVFSHEKNTAEAKRIIEAIAKTYNTPDFYLLKAQIAQFEGDSTAENENTIAYLAMLKANDYGAMYNKYNVLLFADKKETAPKALEIAKIEVDHRPTPDSYDLLAWSYYNVGDVRKALKIVQNHVVGKSFEPRVQYHLACIYKSNNLTEKILPIKEELLGSVYELGPNFENKITQL